MFLLFFSFFLLFYFILFSSFFCFTSPLSCDTIESTTDLDD